MKSRSDDRRTAARGLCLVLRPPTRFALPSTTRTIFGLSACLASKAANLYEFGRVLREETSICGTVCEHRHHPQRDRVFPALDRDFSTHTEIDRGSTDFEWLSTNPAMKRTLRRSALVLKLNLDFLRRTWRQALQSNGGDPRGNGQGAWDIARIWPSTNLR